MANANANSNYDPSPYTNHAINKRLGFKTPRSILLPPYLASNEYFTDFTDALDAVYGPLIDDKTAILEELRNMWVTNPVMEQQVLDNDMIDLTGWSQPERSLLVKQVNLLGMKLQTAGIVGNQSYQNIARFVGQYWFQKGTSAFISFVNLCLGSNLLSLNLWTKDYIHFVPAGDASIGTPIWQGGLWYPTTHVTISANAGDLANIDLPTLANFFYEIANYNLVLNNIDTKFNMQIVDILGDVNAPVVVMGALLNPSIVMSNVFRYGIDGPPVQQTSGKLPTSYLNMGVPLDFTQAYLLGKPSTWIADATGKKLPVYSAKDQATTLNSSVGSNVVSNAVSNFNVMYGPVTWITVPGSSGSSARIPAFSSKVPTATNIANLGTRMVGNRSALLANPTGFTEVSPGLFTPYWN